MTPSDNPNPQQDIEALRKRYEALHSQKIRVEAERSNSEKQLAELQDKARKLYDTDDLESLRELLTNMRAENERRRREYQEHLDAIERDLSAVEAAHQSDETAS